MSSPIFLHRFVQKQHGNTASQHPRNAPHWTNQQGVYRLLAMGLTCWVVAAPGCARVHVSRSLRVEPVEAPQKKIAVVGKGFRIHAKRDGAAVRVDVEAVAYCRQHTTQRAKGFRVTQRRAVGPSLMMEWIMGGLISSAGVGTLLYSGLNPPTTTDGELAPGSSMRTWVTGGAITAAGLGLLIGAMVQQHSLGRSEIALGMKTLRKAGTVIACQPKSATSGRVRVTLSDGHQIEAPVGANGVALVPLPEDVEQRLQREGRRATIEALGDWRSQVRITL